MLGRQSPQNMMDPYRKRRQFFPVFLAVMAVLLVIIGIVIIVLWITGGGFKFNLFSKEPTPTNTMPPTPVMSPDRYNGTDGCIDPHNDHYTTLLPVRLSMR